MSNQDDNQPAIDTGESYSPPVDESAGLNTAAPQQAQPQGGSAGLPDMGPPPIAAEAAQDSVGTGMKKLGQTMGRDIGQGVDEVKNNPIVKRIASYLMGDGGLNPVVLDQGAAQVDPQGQLPPGDRNLLALEAANQKGGPKAAWAMMQTNRVAFNAKQAFAYTAIQGTPQKPADMNAAIDAANQAEQHVLDGSTVKFAAAQGGVTATVSMHGSSQPQVINLSPDQFKAYLNVGGDGQWDKLMENSVPATLQRLSQQQPARAGATPPPRVPQQKGTPVIGQEEPSPGPGTDVNNAPSGKDPWSKRWDDAADPNNQTLEARADRIYGANNAATNQQRNEWIEAQKARTEELENKVDVASEKGRNDIEKARVTGTYRNQGEGIKAQAGVDKAHVYADGKLEQKRVAAEQALKHEEAVNGRSSASNAMRGIVGLVNAGRFNDLNPQQKQAFEQMTSGQPQQPATQPSRQPQATRDGPAQAPQSEDDKARAWVAANPNAPQAAAIKKKLGIQ